MMDVMEWCRACWRLHEQPVWIEIWCVNAVQTHGQMQKMNALAGSWPGGFAWCAGTPIHACKKFESN